MAPDRSAAEDRDLLVEAGLLAGEIAMRHFRNNVSYEEKPDDQGPVSAADLEVNAMLAEHLPAARPGYGWLSEESEDADDRHGAERVFIVDPIDGTRSFIAGEKGFAVALAVAERGRVIAACVHMPARGETFAAALGHGATKEGAALVLPKPPEMADATVLTSRYQMEAKHWPGGVPPMTRQFRPSLAWRMCLVAEGRFNAMLTFRRTWEWDIAAGALIATEAGAVVTDGLGAPLAFNTAEAMQPGVIAAPPALHRGIVARRVAGPDAEAVD